MNTGVLLEVAENFVGPFGLIPASDPDSDFLYSVVDNPYFAINARTGIISTKQKLNYEQVQVRGLEVVATDSNGNIGRTD